MLFDFVCDASRHSGFLIFCCGGIRGFVSVLHALPLCGAAPTFLCSGKEK
jgi:hypothetical protein